MTVLLALRGVFLLALLAVVVWLWWMALPDDAV